VGLGVTASHSSTTGAGLRLSRGAAGIEIRRRGRAPSVQRSTAVLRPLKLKSRALPFISPGVKRTAAGLPWGASLSITAPPG